MKLQSHTKRARHENEDNKDILSDLSDCVLLHIMSFLNARDVVRTCILSTRWKHLWKHLPNLILTPSNFATDNEGFTEFVNQILSLRDSSIVLNALDFECHGHLQHDLLEQIMTYAASNNVNRIRLSYDSHYIPPSLFSCSSLTCLDLCIPKLPKEQPSICISSTTLLNLTICMDCSFDGCTEIGLSTPNLCTFSFIGKSSPYLKFNGSSLFSIKQVNIDIDVPLSDHDLEETLLILQLSDLVNIQVLTLSLTILQALSSSPALDILLERKPPSWHNLKSLEVKVPKEYGYSSMNEREISQLTCAKSKENVDLQEVIKLGWDSSISAGLIEFLFRNSPSANFDILFPKMI